MAGHDGYSSSIGCTRLDMSCGASQGLPVFRTNACLVRALIIGIICIFKGRKTYRISLCPLLNVSVNLYLLLKCMF